MNEKTKSPAELAAEETLQEIERLHVQNEETTRQRMAKLQETEAEQKRRDFKNSPEGMRAILKEVKEKVLIIEHQADDRTWMTASWIDQRGNKRTVGGPGIVALDPEVQSLLSLLVEDNFASVGAIRDACASAMDQIQNLQNLVRERPQEVADLERQVSQLIAAIPPLTSIRILVTHPEPAKEVEILASAK